MKFLADVNFFKKVSDRLRSDGHDIRMIALDSPKAQDSAVLARGMDEGRVILTSDKDFGELAFRMGLPSTCGVVLFRLEGIPAKEQSEFAYRTLISGLEWSGRFSVVTPKKVRRVVLLKRKD